MEMRAGFARLLLGTALVVPAAFATGASAQDAAAAESCQQLVTLVEEGLPEQLASAEPDIIIVAEAGEAERCDRVLTELQAAMEGGMTAEAVESLRVVDTEQAVVRLEEEVVIEGQVLLETQPPEVEVVQGQTEVMIAGGQPEVTVTEQPAEIMIRQAPAIVRMEMPQPTITIEQPAPEIIITMPPPGVEVTNAQPQVEVRQAEPQVTVTQVAPNVEIQLQPAQDPANSQGIQVTDRAGQPVEAGAVMETQAEVAVTQTEATVTYAEPEGQEANVQIQSAEPQITFEQAEPQFELVAGGEPQVQFIQTGEPTVTIQEAAVEGEEPPAEEVAQAEQPVAEPAPLVGAAPEAEATPEAAAAPEAGTELENAEIEVDPNAAEPAAEAVATEEVAVVAPVVEREGYQQIDINELEASELEGAPVYGLEDEEVGEIGELILTEQGQVEQAVIDVGGFLGLGERNVAVPFDQLAILRGEGDDVRVYIDATEERLEAMPEYEG